MKYKIKKVFLLFLITVILFVAVLSSCKPKETNQNYFRSYDSTQLYSKAEKLLTLPEGYEFSSYDSTTGLFIIKQNILAEFGGVDIRYGFSTETEVLLEPWFSEVLDLRSNHAIVVKKEIEGNEIKERIGIINIKDNSFGFDAGNSFIQEYNSSILQYSFLNDNYLIVIGGKDAKPDFNGKIDYSYSVVYDYTSSYTLLEVGRIADTSSSATFKINDGFISVSMPGQVRFYSTDHIQNGYYKEVKKYVPYKATEVSHDYVDVIDYYLGNNEYILAGIRSQDTEFDGYDMVRTGVTGQAEYIKVISIRYNVKSDKDFEAGKVLIVSNDYSSDFIQAITKSFEEASSLGYTKDYKLHKVNNPDDDEAYFYKYIAQKIYDYPLVETNKLMKNGNSILYVAFLLGTTTEGQRIYSTSFEVYTSDRKTEIVEKAFLPLLYVDGLGVERIEPNYSLEPGDLKYFNYSDNSITSIKKSEEKVGYSAYVIHDKILIAERNDLRDPSKLDKMQNFGAVDVQNNKLIVDFEYDFITPSFGGYFIAGNFIYKNYVDAEGKEISYVDRIDYWRISYINGEIIKREILDIYSVHNGSYITRSAQIFRLFANNGTLLIDSADELIVQDLTLEGDSVFASYAYEKRDGQWSLYKIQ